MALKNKHILILIFILAIFPLRLAKFQPHEFIIWNVGQGQWVSSIQENICEHFDIGGEKAPWPKIIELCGYKLNFIWLTHWDWDHVSHLQLAQQKLAQVCVMQWPLTDPPATHPKKLKLKRSIPSCSDLWNQRQQQLQAHLSWPLIQQLIRNDVQEVVGTAVDADSSGQTSHMWRTLRFLKSLSINDQSRIYIFNHRILIPGDAGQQAEHFWSRYLEASIQALILGHHGSQTSSSLELLQHLPQLKLAIASSRRAKYGHPHHAVVERLRSRGTPTLTTEDWGNIHLYY